MEACSNPRPANGRYADGPTQTAARAARATAGRLLVLLLIVIALTTGCLVIPIPGNSYDLTVRTNVSPQTVKSLGPGDVSRTEVLLQLGEPDEVSLEERQFRYQTSRIKWDIFWIVAGGYSATGGDIEVRKYYDLVLRFDDRGTLYEGAWLDGWNPGDLRQKALWVPTSAPPENPSGAPETSGANK